MTAIILSIGDELVLGQTVDTNSAWISQQLAAVGCDVAEHATVADDQPAIERAIAALASRCDALVVSGGLGPTEDDLTRQALAAVLNVPLELNQAWLTRLEEFWSRRGSRMPAANRVQAMIPRGATMIENTAGTAPGIDAELRVQGSGLRVQREDQQHAPRGAAPSSSLSFPNPEPRPLNPPRSCRVFVMPGVPREMKTMFARDVLPHVERLSAGAAIVSRTLHTFGLGESSVAQRLGDLMNRARRPSVGTTVSGGIVSLRVNSRFESRQRAADEAQKTVQLCRAALGDLIFGEDDETLAQVVARLLLDDPVAQASAPAVVTAESCTGGLLAKMLTDIPGSSRYFRQGYVTYSNQAKIDMLHVGRDLLDQHGAVSEPVALAMATGARAASGGATYALSITGIAGPDGGTPAKPVGTVCFGFAHPGGAAARTFTFPGDREFIRDRSAKMALTILRYHLLGKPMPF